MRQEDFVKGNGKAIDQHERRALQACVLQRLALKLGPRGLLFSYGEEQEARSPSRLAAPAPKPAILRGASRPPRVQYAAALAQGTIRLPA